MSPSDEDQAQTAVDFALQKGKRRFLLIADQNRDNQAYSQGLINSYQAALKSRSMGDDSSWAPPQLPSGEQINAFDPDCVLYAGELDTARVFIRLLKEVRGQHMPMVILSDSSVNESLFTNQVDELENVYATYQLTDAEYRDNVNVYGRDAFAIVAQLVEQANSLLNSMGDWRYRLRRRLNMHRVTDIRRAMVASMQINAVQRRPYVGAAGNTFRISGTRRENARFHIWQVVKGRAIDIDCLGVQGCNDSSSRVELWQPAPLQNRSLTVQAALRHNAEGSAPQ